MRLALIFILALSLHILHAQDSSSQKTISFAEKMRPTLMKVVGERWTTKLIGSAPEVKIDNSVVLPALPKLLVDARSTAVFDKKQDKIILKPEMEEKYRYAFVKEIYEATRQTKPNDDEVGKLMNVLSQGGSREGVYHSLVLDSSYGGMENYDKPVKSNAADFAIYFYGRYIGKKVAKESLKGMNIYSLKRLVADKALDIIDAYGDNREDLEKWYAVMSSDLASKFPSVWSGKMRKDTSSIDHKLWANQVPVQHIKSETLIKIHGAFNSMM
ncbi:MAG: hypothetical protein H7281_10325 [Bacteriovorax sp.]|nr:hypothetical protein [Bacteriovorax sp.]